MLFYLWICFQPHYYSRSNTEYLYPSRGNSAPAVVSRIIGDWPMTSLVFSHKWHMHGKSARRTICLTARKSSASVTQTQVYTFVLLARAHSFFRKAFAIMSFQVVECKTIDGVAIRGRFYGIDGKGPAIIMTPGVCRTGRLARLPLANSELLVQLRQRDAAT